MDPQFEEFAQRVTRDVALEIDKRFAVAVDDLKRDAQSNLESLKHDAQSNLGSLKRDAQSNLESLKRDARLNMESLKDEIKLAAEGYGATLESIDRRLKDLETKWDNKIGDHDSVLADHNQRITTLEQSPHR